MCDCQLPPQGTQDDHVRRPGRRLVLGASLGAAAVLAQGAGPAAAAGPQKPSRPAAGSLQVVLVGTSGGPIWWQDSRRRGISTVVEAGGRRYLVDAGHGTSSGLRECGLLGPLDGRNDLTSFAAGFLTHLHSDHVTDLSTVLLQGWIGGGLGTEGNPFVVYGPGDRGSLPSTFPAGRPVPPVFNPENPTPGTESMVAQLLGAFATDINDRVFDSASPPVDSRIQAKDIALPAGTPPHEASGRPPRVSPFVVHEDDAVRVTATLVDHGQMVPSFAYRFDTDDASVVISGDTTVTPNLDELAADADMLVHEVMDEAWVRQSIAGLPVGEEVKQAYVNHMLGAHTTTEQLEDVVKNTGVRHLVLHHLVPGELPKNGWTRATRRLDRAVRASVVLGEDGMRLGARSGRR